MKKVNFEGQLDNEGNRVFPYMACPRDSYPMDPLEGCTTCKGVGYHHSIRNPKFKLTKVK